MCKEGHGENPSSQNEVSFVPLTQNEDLDRDLDEEDPVVSSI